MIKKIFIALLFFGLWGWLKGFLKSIIGPFSLLIGITFSIIYFAKTKNFVLSLGISIVGPIIINIIIGLLMRILKIGTDKSHCSGWSSLVTTWHAKRRSRLKTTGAFKFNVRPW